MIKLFLLEPYCFILPVLKHTIKNQSWTYRDSKVYLRYDYPTGFTGCVAP